MLSESDRHSLVADDGDFYTGVVGEQNDLVVLARKRLKGAREHPLRNSFPDWRAGRQRQHQLSRSPEEPRCAKRETLIEMSSHHGRSIAPVICSTSPPPSAITSSISGSLQSVAEVAASPVRADRAHEVQVPRGHQSDPAS